MARAARRPGARQHPKRRSSRGRSAPFEQMNLNAAGIDVGATEHWVAVTEDRDEEPVRRFGAFTADLYVLAEWLRPCQIETVVIESTGVYGLPCSKCSKSVALRSSWSLPTTRAKCPGARRT